MQSFRKYPFARLLLYLVIGLLLAYYDLSPSFMLMCWVGLTVLFLYSILRFHNRYVYAWVYGLGLFLVVAGMGAYQVEQQKKEIVDSFSGWEEEIAVKIEDIPVEKPKTVKLCVKVLNNDLHKNVRLILYVKKDEGSLSLKEGDWILVDKCALKKRGKSQMNGFDYEAYLKGKGYSGSFYLAEYHWKMLSEGEAFTFFGWAHYVQKKLVEVFSDQGIKGDNLGVLAALSIGDKVLLDNELRNSYALTGASHILAVSGLHVSVVFIVFVKILTFLLRGDKFEKVRVLVSLLVLWIYTFVTGLSPSVVRASIMLTMASFSTLLNRKSQTFNAVFASAFFMLLYSPRYLFDVGFQLSYLAVVSILMFQKPIYETLVPRHFVAEKIWSLLSVSLAAQLGTLPLSIYYFHQSSNLFWLSGFVVIPLSSIIIYNSILMWMLHWIPCLGTILSHPLDFSVSLMNCSVRWMEQLPGVVAKGLSFGGTDLLAFYFILGALYLFTGKQSFKRLFFLLSVVLAYAIFHTLKKLSF